MRTKRDRIFFLVQIIVAVLALVLINLKKNYWLNIPYITFISLGIFFGRFHYSLALLYNKEHAFFNVRNNSNVDPSDFLLITYKFVFLLFYTLGIILVTLPENIFN